MNNLLRVSALQTTKALYLLIRPLLFAESAEKTHQRTLDLLSLLDSNPAACYVLKALHRIGFSPLPITAGGVNLPYPFILAAGFVKGVGFEKEEAALTAVRQQVNIMPGWRSVPALVGPVEFGSFTRWPRPGNSGVVLWRDSATRSSQNRIGLKNPGAVAAAAFLSQRREQLPPIYGINIAPSPGVTDLRRRQEEAVACVQAFISRGVCPSWFTLNLSCPNTEDDPGDRQTEDTAREICGALVEMLARTNTPAGEPIPLWIKVGPDLARSQYQTLMRVCHELGVRAVVATNTDGQPAPDNSGYVAGVGGGRLHDKAVAAACILQHEKTLHNYQVDVIGCGGVQDPASYLNFAACGVRVVQYWTTLIYRGPLAAALILNETRMAIC